MKKLIVVNLTPNDDPEIMLLINDEEDYNIVMDEETGKWVGGPDYIKCLKIGNLVITKVITPEGEDKEVVCFNEQHLILDPLDLLPLVSLGQML